MSSILGESEADALKRLRGYREAMLLEAQGYNSKGVDQDIIMMVRLSMDYFDLGVHKTSGEFVLLDKDGNKVQLPKFITASTVKAWSESQWSHVTTENHSGSYSGYKELGLPGEEYTIYTYVG